MTSHIPYDFSEPWYLELYYLISKHLRAFPDILITSNLITLWSENNSDIFSLVKLGFIMAQHMVYTGEHSTHIQKSIYIILRFQVYYSINIK